MPSNLNDKLKSIRLLLLDVDGVMTDGRLYYHADGSESKAFHVRDGLGLRLLMDAGIEVGIVTGRVSESLKRRCEDLKIKRIYEGIIDKARVLPQIEAFSGIDIQHTGFIGDDIIDLPLIHRVRFSAAPADAHPDVLSAVDYVARAKGGKGVVREVIELVMKSREKWETVIKRFS